MISGFLERHWYKRSAVSILLVPLAAIYAAVVAVRRFLYRAGLFRSVRLRVPVIVVGNLMVGGTGKTPLVLELARTLANLGWHPAIISRGYGGTERRALKVSFDSDPRQVGDEPALLAERSGCPVWIGKDRAATGKALLGVHADCDVILCDDGLQHYGLSRDFEIAVQDERGYGNGLMLPAGPLRESSSRPVDAVVLNGTLPLPNAGSMSGPFLMRLSPKGFYRIDDPSIRFSASTLKGRRLHAVAGIGNPQRFFETLRTLGLDPVCHPFPDHHVYSEGDLAFADCDVVLMTEKDAVKCRRLKRAPAFLAALRVDAELEPKLIELLLRRLHGHASA